jgi:hypothetical protein
MTWEDELKTLLSGNWRPCFLGGFAAKGQVSLGTVFLYPPQGVYSCWTGKLMMAGADRPVVVHGNTAVETVGLVMQYHEKIMDLLKDIDMSTGTNRK